jgi:hypothetical protein
MNVWGGRCGLAFGVGKGPVRTTVVERVESFGIVLFRKLTELVYSLESMVGAFVVDRCEAVNRHMTTWS